MLCDAELARLFSPRVKLELVKVLFLFLMSRFVENHVNHQTLTGSLNSVCVCVCVAATNRLREQTAVWIWRRVNTEAESPSVATAAAAATRLLLASQLALQVKETAASKQPLILISRHVWMLIDPVGGILVRIPLVAV